MTVMDPQGVRRREDGDGGLADVGSAVPSAFITSRVTQRVRRPTAEAPCCGIPCLQGEPIVQPFGASRGAERSFRLRRFGAVTVFQDDRRERERRRCGLFASRPDKGLGSGFAGGPSGDAVGGGARSSRSLRAAGQSKAGDAAFAGSSMRRCERRERGRVCAWFELERLW